MLERFRIESRIVVLEARLRAAEVALRDVHNATNAWTIERASEILRQIHHRVRRYFKEAYTS